MFRKNYLIVLILMFVLSACSNGTKPAADSAASVPASSASASEEAKEAIVLGSTMALSGGAGYLGTTMRETFEIYIRKVNEQGGINGRPLRILYYDDENSPEKAVQNTQKLIQKDGVKVILGPSTAQTSGAVQPIADREKALIFSLSSAYAPNADSYVFNNSLGQTAMHEIHHEWFKSKGFQKVGLIATTDASGDISVDIVQKQYHNKDGIQYFVERMNMDTLDVTPELTRLISNGIEALVIIGPGAPPAIVVKNAGQLGLQIPLLMTHSQASYTFANSIKDIIPDNLYIASTAPIAYKELSPDNPLQPLATEFAEDYEKATGKKIDHISAVGFDSIHTVVEAIKKTGTDDPVKLKEVLETEFKDFVTSTAILNYSKDDHQGSSLDGAVLVKLNPDQTFSLEFEPKFW
jgi:branched-chain amino acid transport system substrate-binding protein